MVDILYCALDIDTPYAYFIASVKFNRNFVFWYGMLSTVFHGLIDLVLRIDAALDIHGKTNEFVFVCHTVCSSDGI